MNFTNFLIKMLRITVNIDIVFIEMLFNLFKNKRDHRNWITVTEISFVTFQHYGSSFPNIHSSKSDVCINNKIKSKKINEIIFPKAGGGNFRHGRHHFKGNEIRTPFSVI